MGGVSDAIRRSAESFGAEIRTDAAVKQILVRGGRAVGVALENGEESARRSSSAASTRGSRSST